MTDKPVPPTPRRIIISHVYSPDNKGDAALTSVLIRDLRRAYPLAELRILRLEPVAPGTQFEDVPEQPAFMSYALNRYRHPAAKLAYTVWMVAATLLWAACRRLTGVQLWLPRHVRAIARLYDQADLVVPVGGGYIRSRKGLVFRLNVPLLLHPLLFGHLLGKPTVLYAQSVGPFYSRADELLAGFVLKRMDGILLREDVSVRLLERLGVTAPVQRAIDSGFLLRSRGNYDLRAQYGIAPDRLLIGVTVRAWLDGEAQEQYERAVAAALDEAVESHSAQIIFIPQVTAAKGDDDRRVSQRVWQYMRHRSQSIVVMETPDHHTIKAMYDSLDVLLGTRFHSVIFSLTSHVPVIAIEYEHKTSGIMRDLRLEDWVIRIEDVTADKLTALLQAAIADKDDYHLRLRHLLPPYVRRAEQAVHLLTDRYAARAGR